MKQWIINFLLRRTLNAVVLEDVIKEDKGKIFLGKEELTSIKIQQLSAEAKAIEGFDLWKIINETIKQDALDRGWNKATSIEGLNAGKTMFYTLDLQSSIIKAIRARDLK